MANDLKYAPGSKAAWGTLPSRPDHGSFHHGLFKFPLAFNGPISPLNVRTLFKSPFNSPQRLYCRLSPLLHIIFAPLLRFLARFVDIVPKILNRTPVLVQFVRSDAEADKCRRPEPRDLRALTGVTIQDVVCIPIIGVNQLLQVVQAWRWLGLLISPAGR